MSCKEIDNEQGFPFLSNQALDNMLSPDSLSGPPDSCHSIQSPSHCQDERNACSHSRSQILSRINLNSLSPVRSKIEVRCVLGCVYL